MSRRMTIDLLLAAGVLLAFAVGCTSLQRKLLYYPTHRPPDNALANWTQDGLIIGCYRPIESPHNVWLMLHGNAGQAADRTYALPSFSDNDAVFILEYPGYGQRAGTPSQTALNHAAQDAYFLLRRTYPHHRVCVVGESVGSGPAAFLAGLDPPPDKLVLIVPFDELSRVAKDHFPSILVCLMLKDNWDNRQALEHYRGPVDIFGASADTVIPVKHAQALAAAAPSARFILIPGGHNDWSDPGRVQIRYP